VSTAWRKRRGKKSREGPTKGRDRGAPVEPRPKGPWSRSAHIEQNQLPGNISTAGELAPAREEKVLAVREGVNTGTATCHGPKTKKRGRVDMPRRETKTKKVG